MAEAAGHRAEAAPHAAVARHDVRGPGRRVVEPLEVGRRRQRGQRLDLVQHHVARLPFERDPARAAQEPGDRQALGQVFDGVPVVVLGHRLGHDVERQQHRSGSEQRHGAGPRSVAPSVGRGWRGAQASNRYPCTVAPTRRTISARLQRDHRRQLQHVAAQRQAEDLRGDQPGARRRRGARLAAQPRDHAAPPASRRWPACARAAASLVTAVRSSAISVSSSSQRSRKWLDQRRADRASRGSAAEVGQAQVELGRGGEQPFLVAEVAHHHRRVDAGGGGDRRGWWPPGSRWRRTARARPRGSPPWWRRSGAARGHGLGHVNKYRSTVVDIRARHRPKLSTLVDQHLLTSRSPPCPDRPAPRSATPTFDTDVLIVGAGPTGLTLADGAGRARRARHRDRPPGRGRQHLARRRRACPHARGARAARRRAPRWSRAACRRSASRSATATAC